MSLHGPNRLTVPPIAARIGASAAIRYDVARHVINLPERTVFERAEADARAALGEAGYAEAFADGGTLSREEAVAEAIQLAEEIITGSPI